MRKKTTMEWNASEVKRQINREAQRALKDAGEHILEQANRRIPHDEGILQNSGDVSVDGRNLEGYVSYDTPYAIRLHEHPEYNFQKGREGKWLENTISDILVQNQVNNIISQRLRGVFR